MNRRAGALLFSLLAITSSPEVSGQAADSVQREEDSRLGRDLLIIGTVYAGSMIALNEMWYKEFERQPFTFFNDNPEWLQMDKAGHIYTSFHLTEAWHSFFRKHRVGDRKALWFSAVGSFVMMTPIEWMDAYSAAYGASTGDVLANLGGSALYILPTLSGTREYFQLKFSFMRSPYAEIRPRVLGSGLSQVLKDYNGQTYWLSLDMDRFIRRWPKVLNLAIGYGAEGMVHARTEVNTANGYHAYRQYYIGIDPDLSWMESRKKWINMLIRLADMIRIPAPALEMSESGLRFHYFK